MSAPKLVRLGFVLVQVFAVSVAAFVGEASASGGGGCGRPITRAAGSEVVIEGFCFQPTVLQVRPGGTITFRNADFAEHTVTGANGAWGSYRTLSGISGAHPDGESATYRFARVGVFPFFCALHPGMTGAVVVGRPFGTAAPAIARGDAYPVQPRPDIVYVRDVVRVARRAPVEPSSAPWRATAIVAFGLFAMAGAGLGTMLVRGRGRTAK